MNRIYQYIVMFMGSSLLLFMLTDWVTVATTSTLNTATQPSRASSVEEICIPAGEYVRGCAVDVVNWECGIESSPLNIIYVDAFFIDRLPVTNAQYAACQSSSACPPPISNASTTRPDYYTNPQYAQYPVLNVRWEYADAYCRWVNKRLPTEAEWEKAARGTDRRLFPWGNELPTCDRTNTAILFPGDVLPRPCVGDTVAVGSYPQNASPYGVLDMVGNTREFVSDFYDKHYHARAPYYNPQGPDRDLGKGHFARGGGWFDHAILSSNWVRHDEAAAEVYEHIGFRCARNAPVAPTPTPIPTPTPTPVPSDASRIGPEGGLLWITHPHHLTAIRIPSGSLSSEVTLTVAYTQPLPTGNFQGMDHFFVVDGSQFNDPLKLLLGFRNYVSIISGTHELYRLESGTWVTDNITMTERTPRHIVAWIDQSGTYGILGRTNRIYLPLVLRQR
jgi:formylglycine-generating enzyme required for sulfatase activity